MQAIDSWATPWPPLSLAILASIARQQGAEVDLLDCNVETDHDRVRTAERVRAFGADLAVLATGFPSSEGDAASALAIAGLSPRTRIAGIGVFFTLLGAQALAAAPGFELGLVGEPELGFAELLGRLERREPLDDLPGAVGRRGDAPWTGPDREPIADLDSLPFAARDLLPNHRYHLPHDGRAFTLVEIARGCPFPCSYCVAPVQHGTRIRRHSIAYLVDEIAQCVERHGIRDFLFWGECFTAAREHALALCEALARLRPAITWAASTRTDEVDGEVVAAMRGAGCRLLALGIESGSDEILNGAGKRTRVEDAWRAVALCRAAGIPTVGHFILGLPGETPATLAETSRLALDLGLDYLQAYAAVPYPRTRLGQLARSQDWLRSRRWSDYDFGGASVLDVGTISPNEVDQARADLFRRFYLRPRYLLRRAVELARHPRQLLQASRFLGWITKRRRAPA